MNHTLVRRLVLAQALLAAGAASAADIQTQPIIDVRAEQNDNFRMTPGGSPKRCVVYSRLMRSARALNAR